MWLYLFRSPRQFYTQTLGFMQGPNLAPGLDKSWPAHVEFQSVSFSAAACYWEVGVCVVHGALTTFM